MQASVIEPTNFYFVMRISSLRETTPDVSIYAICYSDEPVICNHGGRIAPGSHSNPRRRYIYASRVFTPAPYTRSMRLTVRMPDTGEIGTQMDMIALDESGELAEESMREDLLNYLEGTNGDAVENARRVEMKRYGKCIHVSFRDSVTGRRTWWDLWTGQVVNTRAGVEGRVVAS